jgi:predicted dehydrogenase
MGKADDVLRAGGVGTGGSLQHAHLRICPKFWEKARLVGFYDIDRRRSEQAAEKYRGLLVAHAEEHPRARDAVEANRREVTVHDSLDSLLEQVNLIDVCTHARGRCAMTLSALNRGVHAMTEKPRCRVWTEADRTARCAESQEGVFLQYTDDNAFDLEYLMLSDLLRQGLAGKVQHLRSIRGSDLGARTALQSQARAQDNGGGAPLDYGSHGITGAWTAIGYEWKPVRVFTNRIGVLHRHRILEGEPFVMEVDDNAQSEILLQHPEDDAWLTVFMETSYAGLHSGDNPDGGTHRNRDLWVQGESRRLESLRDGCFRIHRGVTEYDPAVDELHDLSPAGDSFRRTPSAFRPDSHMLEIEHFTDCVPNDERPGTSAEEGRYALEYAWAATKSFQTNQPVTLPLEKPYPRYSDAIGTLVWRSGDGASAEGSVPNSLVWHRHDDLHHRPFVLLGDP